MRSTHALLATVLSTILLRAIACSPQPVAQDQTAVVAPHVAPAEEPTGGRPSSTRSVQCGNETCIAGETSCIRLEGKPPKCAAKDDRDGYARYGKMEDAIVDCDDDSDCAGGEHCCAGQYWGGTGPHMHMCEKEQCAEAISCVVPTDCPAGLKCRTLDSGDGHCEPADPGAQCGATRCNGASPVCCWNNATQRGTCIADPRETEECRGEDESRLRCRGRRDCGGYDCCLEMVNGTDCWSSCPGPSLGVACETMADCPAEGPGPGGMRQRYDTCENGACTGKLCSPGGDWVPCDSL